MTVLIGDFVMVRYQDHLEFRFSDPLALQPEARRRYGKLSYQCPEYLIIVSDEKDEPPTVKGGDQKAAGLVILRRDVLELKRIGR